MEAPSNAESEVAVCARPAAPAVATCFAHRRTDHVVDAKPTGASPYAFTSNAAYDPAHLRSAYNLTQIASTAGLSQTVAVVDAYDSPTAESDLAIYRSNYNLSACTTANGCFRKVSQSGVLGPYPAFDYGWAQEIALDLEMVSAICSNCRILLVEANSNSLGDLGASVNTAAQQGATTIVNSYGGPEYSWEANDEASFYNHPGLALTVAAGDSGYGVDFPAASQYVTAVGGTKLVQDSSCQWPRRTPHWWPCVSPPVANESPRPG